MVLCDLNIPWPCHDYSEPTKQDLAKLKLTVLFSLNLQYTHILINFILDQANIKNNNNKQQGSSGKLNPIDLSFLRKDPLLSHVKLYTRLTLRVADTSNSVNLSKFSQHFDLMSIQPLTEKLLLLLITQDIDLISLRFDEKLPCFLRHKLVNSAVEKGIKFEIVYQPLFNLSSAQVRRQFYQNTLSLIRASRNRGLIVSSGAKELTQVKLMFDISNLLIVLGLNHNTCMNSMTDLPLKVILNGNLRLKSYKQLIRMEENDDNTAKKRKSESSGILERQKKKFLKS